MFSLIDLSARYTLCLSAIRSLPDQDQPFRKIVREKREAGWKNKEKKKKGEERKKLKKKKPKFQRIVIGSKLEPHSSSTPSSLFIPYREMSFGMRNMKENVYGIRVYMDDK